MLALLLVVVAPRWISLVDAAPTRSRSKASDESLTKWIRSKEGHYISEKIHILEDEIIVTDTIEPQELILKIPAGAGLPANDEDNDGICATIREFFKAKEDPGFAPLVQDVLLAHKKMPSTWSTAGKEFLESILGNSDEADDDDVVSLPPQLATRWAETIWYADCLGGNRKPVDLAEVAAVLQYQRQNHVLPLVDRIQHSSNPSSINTDTIVYQQQHDYRATRRIEKGEVLTMSLNFCRYYCAGEFSTPELFRNFGIIEDYPQVWHFVSDEENNEVISFEISQAYDVHGNVLDEQEVRWWPGMPTKEGRAKLFQTLVDYQDTKERLLNQKNSITNKLPPHELQLIKDYFNALTKALSLAIKSGEFPSKTEFDPSLFKETPYQGELGDLIGWLEHRGALINSKVEIRKVKSPTSAGGYRYGVFAREDLNPNELIALIPEGVMLDPDIPTKSPSVFEGSFTCAELGSLIKVFENWKSPDFGPYVEYLTKEVPGQLPHVWSNTSQELLVELLNGGDRNRDEVLPPFASISFIRDDWRSDCTGSDLEFEINSVMTALKHHTDGVLIPFYDIIAHSNGHDFNCDIDQFFGEEDMRIRTTRKVLAGHEIYRSLNLCNDCGNKRSTYGTAEMLRDVGIVETLPHFWIFPQHELSFHLVPLYTIDGSESGNYTVVLATPVEDIDEALLSELREERDRLRSLADFDIRKISTRLPSHEFELLKDYEGALFRALDTFLRTFDEEEQDCEDSSQSCGLITASYDEFEYDFVNVFETELTMCNIERSLLYARWEFVEEVQSLYQRLAFLDELEYNTMCLELDNIFQVCSDFRPHYHELQVHYPARFMEEIKRVVWIGGGDSMLLHEMLKYPSLELALGLELDQNVTRYSFKHFGSQPYWENDKVEWWFGDAAKSLLMLPRDYFQTFDLVLIDLSETVMSFAVTDKLDITEALTLLMKPGGIFVKNEHYFRKMSKMFKNTLEVHVNDLPSVCAQAMILGSNEIDFLDSFGETTDHGVDTLYLLPNDEMSSIAHGFKRNYDFLRYRCSDFVDDLEVQKRSPGILMIVEAENTSKINDIAEREEEIISALTALGLSVKESNFSKGRANLVLQEGYIVIHHFPTFHYAAIDIHLWSSFDQQSNVKKALLLVLEAGSSSSYRIVAGGMFGTNSWKADESKRGPGQLQECLDDGEEPRMLHRRVLSSNFQQPSQEDILAVTKASLNLMPYPDVLTLVVCGEKGERCIAEEAMQQVSTNKHNIITVSSCGGIKGINEFMGNFSIAMKKCENAVHTKLDEVIGEQRLGGVIIDPSVSQQMAQIVHKTLESKRSRIMFLDDNLFVLAPLADPSEDWRTNFVDRFMHVFLLWEPVYMVELELDIVDDKAMNVVVTSSGDRAFFSRLKVTREKLEKETKFLVDVKSVEGGKIRYMPQFDETHAKWYYPHDYSQKDNSEQYLAQEPVTLQALLQLEIGTKGAKLTIDRLKEAVKVSFSAAGVPLNDIVHYSDLGEGCLVTASWPMGRAIVIWDGRIHVDVNLMMDDENFEVIQRIEGNMVKHIEGLAISLRDVFPRGYGRNVNFKKDLTMPRKLPKWATSKPETSPPTFGKPRK